MLSFDYATATHSVLSIQPTPTCTGHRPLVPGEDYVLVPDEGVSLGELTQRVSDALFVDESSVSLTAAFEMLRSRACRDCGARKEFMRPLVLARAEAAQPCGDCGGKEFDVDAGTGLEGPQRTLAELGVPPGKAVIAHWHGQAAYVIRV
jgi:hypothetical protein